MLFIEKNNFGQVKHGLKFEFISTKAQKQLKNLRKMRLKMIFFHKMLFLLFLVL